MSLPFFRPSKPFSESDTTVRSHGPCYGLSVKFIMDIYHVHGGESGTRIRTSSLTMVFETILATYYNISPFNNYARLFCATNHGPLLAKDSNLLDNHTKIISIKVCCAGININFLEVNNENIICKSFKRFCLSLDYTAIITYDVTFVKEF